MQGGRYELVVLILSSCWAIIMGEKLNIKATFEPSTMASKVAMTKRPSFKRGTTRSILVRLGAFTIDYSRSPFIVFCFGYPHVMKGSQTT